MGQKTFQIYTQLIRNLFLNKVIPNVYSIGRLKYLLKNLEFIIADPLILNYVEGQKIPLLQKLLQNFPPCFAESTKQEYIIV